MTDTTFDSLGLAEPLCRALAAEGYVKPTPIQAQAIPSLLQGRDLLGIAQTGTGKTAAFGLPLLQLLNAKRERPPFKGPRALILAPTRELVLQIADALKVYGRHFGLSQAVVVGGVGMQPQIRAMSRGVDILVATPGRLLDLIQQRCVALGDTRYLVLDEADRMLDMGFVRDVKRIVALMPRDRQSLLFSATMPNDVEELVREMLRDPVRVAVTPQATTVEKIEQRVHHVDAGAKRDLLVQLMADPAMARVIVFTRTKHGADRVATHLDRAGIRADAIHGNKTQGARQRALGDFRDGRVRVLVATDIAARGIDVDGITHVINFELPNVPESYVHRIGRTARAGAAGIAIAFCSHEERSLLRDIERMTKVPLTVIGQAPAEVVRFRPAGRPQGQRPQGQRPQGQRPNGQRGFKPKGDSRFGDKRPQGERPHGDRPQSDRPQGERRQSERPQADRREQPAGDQARRPRFQRRGRAA